MGKCTCFFLPPPQVPDVEDAADSSPPPRAGDAPNENMNVLMCVHFAGYKAKQSE